MRLYAEFQRFNPFCRPDWRFERVLRLVDRLPAPGRCSRRDDDFVRRARRFVLRWRERAGLAEREELFWEDPGLFYAYHIHERQSEDPETAYILQARLLSRQPFAKIAEAMKTTEEAVAWYEAIFFHVADRLVHRDWITKQVLLPALLRHHYVGPAADPVAEAVLQASVRDRGAVAAPFLDASLKFFAYFGGEHLVDFMVTGFQSGKPLASLDHLPAWMDEQWSASIRRRSMQASMRFEVNKYNVMELFHIHARIKELENSEDAQGQQKSAHERHIKGMLDDIPWSVGNDGEELLAGSPLGAADAYAAELRDDEVLRAGAGLGVEGLAEKAAQRLPPPRKRVVAVLGESPAAG